MKRKRYEVRGMMEWHPVFRAGRTRVTVSFTGGHLCGGACTPASYTTSDPVVQKIIEDSEAYAGGRIVLGQTWELPDSGNAVAYESPDEAPVAGSPGAPDHSGDAPVPLQVMEFRDLDSAGDFLQKKKGVGVDAVFTRAQCVALARQLGIELRIKEEGAS